MSAAASVVVGAALLGAACGGETTSADVAQCLRDGGATVDSTPRVSNEVDSRDFSPVLAPATDLVARGELSADSGFLLYQSTEEAADRAEERALEFVRLFGAGRDYVLRRDSVLLVLAGSLPEDDEKLAKECAG